IINVLGKTMCNKANKDRILRIICLDFGAVWQIMEMMKKIQSCCSIKVSCIGKDVHMFEECQEYARKNRITGLSFAAADILSLPYRREYFDIGILAGSLSTISAPQCIEVLQNVKPYFKKGATLLASNVTHTMYLEDPKVCYILDQFAGIKLRYKTPQDLRSMFEKAGYKWEGYVCDEPHRFHCIATGTVS
ncbi:MAG: methyltransferase domain-containing protein, partial [Syntrophorhabdus sp.]